MELGDLTSPGTGVEPAAEMTPDPAPLETKPVLPPDEKGADPATDGNADSTPEAKEAAPPSVTKPVSEPESKVLPEVGADPAPESKALPDVETREQDPTPETRADPAEPAPKSRKRKQATPQQFRPPVEEADQEMRDEGQVFPPGIKMEPLSPESDAQAAGGPKPVEAERTAATRMLPIHCKVEFAPTANQEGGNPGRDDYAIIPSDVKLCDLIKSALAKLGFEEGLDKCAEGAIQLKNWKPLSFSSIADKDDVTVGALFTDVLSHLTLNIKIKDNSGEEATDSTDPGATGGSKVSMFGGAVCEVRRRLLQVLERRGATLLVSHGCPFSQTTIGAILQGHYSKHITPSKLQAFYRWFNLYTSLTDYTMISPDLAEGSARYRTRYFSPGRTLFDPMTEVPKLMKWFKQSPRPSRAQLQVYLVELNASDYRKQGVMLQYSSLAIWFKNARVKYRGFTKDRLLGGVRKQPRGVASGEPRSGNKENQPVDLSQPEHLRNHSSTEGGKSEAEKRGGSPEKRVTREPRLPPPSSLPSGQPGKAPPVLLVPAPAHFPNGFHQLPPQMLMQPGHMALTQNMAAFPRHALMGQAPIGMQPHLMVGQTPMAVQPSFPPFLDMRRLPDYASPGGPQPTMVGGGQPPIAASGHLAMTPGHPPVSTMGGGKDLTRQSGQQQLSIPNYTPVKNSAVNGGTNGVETTSQHQGKQSTGPVVKVEQPDYGDYSSLEGDSPEEGEDQRGPPTPGVIHEAIPSMVSHGTLARSHASKPTRKRFNIDYAHDLPKLQAWFEANTRPDRDTIERYVDELNASEFRVGQQEKYTPRVVYVWFKNARAKLLRGQKLSQRWHQLMGGDPTAAAEHMNGGGEMHYDEEEAF